MPKATTATVEVVLSLEQVADTVRSLGRDGMRELLRLVPELRKVETPLESDPACPDVTELRAWYAAQAREVGPEYRSMQDDDLFLGGLTVREYFDLSDKERQALWDGLYAIEVDRLEALEEVDVPSDAVPARQERHS